MNFSTLFRGAARVWLLALLLTPTAALAADGDGCATGSLHAAGYEAECVMLCDSKTSADSSCTQYRFPAAPDIIQIEIAEDDGCAGAAAVTFTTQSSTATDTHTLSTWALTKGGTTLVTVEGSSAQPLAYLNTSLGTMTSCTDFDVKMHLYYERR